MTNDIRGVSLLENDIRIRIASTIGAVEPCTPLERAARAVAASDDVEIDGSERGEILFGRRKYLYWRYARAAIEGLRVSKAELVQEALAEHRRLSDVGIGEAEIMASCFEKMLDAVLNDER